MNNCVPLKPSKGGTTEGSLDSPLRQEKSDITSLLKKPACCRIIKKFLYSLKENKEKERI